MMADEKDQIEIELDPADEPEMSAQDDVVVETVEEKVEKTAKQAVEDTIDPEEGINDLKNKLQEEQRRRLEAESRAQAAIQRQYQAQNETEDANFALVEGAIKTVTKDGEVLRDAYKEALAVGDYDKAAEINEIITENKIRLAELQRGFQYMKAQRERPKEAPQRQAQAPSDPVEALASQLSARSADWIRRNPQYATDQRLYQKMVAAHQMVTADGIEPDTDGYFEAMEETLKIRRAPERAPARVEKEPEEDAMSEAAKVTQKRSAPPAAPVSRSSGGPGAPRSNVVRLTRAEIEAARDMGMTEQEYARNKMTLQKEGRL